MMRMSTNADAAKLPDLLSAEVRSLRSLDYKDDDLNPIILALVKSKLQR